MISTWRDRSAPGATGRYSYGAGTSVAAAHTSGVVALLLAQGMSPIQAVQRIIETARPVSCGVGCHGLLDAAAAVAAPERAVIKGAATPASAAKARPPAGSAPTHASTAPTATPLATDPAPRPQIAVGAPDERSGTGVAATTAARGSLAGVWMALWVALSMAAGAGLFPLLRRRYSADTP